MKLFFFLFNLLVVIIILEVIVIRIDILILKEVLKKILRFRLKIGEEFEYKLGDFVLVYC